MSRSLPQGLHCILGWREAIGMPESSSAFQPYVTICIESTAIRGVRCVSGGLQARCDKVCRNPKVLKECVVCQEACTSSVQKCGETNLIAEPNCCHALAPARA